MKALKILIADDHPLLLKGIIVELEQRDYTDIHPANDGLEAYRFIVEEKPDIAILDIEMPILSGFEVIKKAIEVDANTKFIILTSHKEKAFILKAKKINISGYLLKDEPFSEIDKCIQAVQKGNTYFSKTFDHIFSSKVSPELKKIKFLSPSERTIIRLIAQEKTTKEIGDLLSISHRTVEKHRANIIAKLDLSAKADSLTVYTSMNKEMILSF